MSFLSHTYLDLCETTLCASPFDPRSSILTLFSNVVRSVQLPSNYDIHNYNK